MSQLRERKFRQFFNGADIDGDGVITRKDVTLMGERYLAARQVPADSAEARRLVEMLEGFWAHLLAPFDSDGDGKVDFSEVVAGLTATLTDPPLRPDPIEQIGELFFVLADTDRDGKINLAEFSDIFGVAGQAAPADSADVFSRLDRDASGALSREEYHKAVTEFFYGEDATAAATHLFGRVTE